MSQIAAQALIGRLSAWGVDTVFGLPGDGINGMMEGLRRNSDTIRFMLVHHEEAAAFMATAYAKQTGRIGVCLATSGPGGIHLLNGLYDAKLDHVPVLAITGMQETSVLGTGYQQEVQLDRLFADVAEYNQMITNPAQLPALVDLAIRTAYARRGVAHLTVPNDIQVADAGDNPWPTVAPALAPDTSAVYLAPPVRPREQDVIAAAEVLNGGGRVAVLVGAGARGCADAVERLADTLGAPVIKTLSGKMVLADDSPYPEHGVRFGAPAPDYAAWARAAGGHGAHVAKAAELPEAMASALAHDGPALVDVSVDPNEPPLPGKVTYEQATKFAKAFLSGQPHEAAIATTLFKDRIQQLKAS